MILIRLSRQKAFFGMPVIRQITTLKQYLFSSHLLSQHFCHINLQFVIEKK
ncbi:MAG: hypothetical protein ACOY0S_00255 [Patescibacteria group bacterium]